METKRIPLTDAFKEFFKNEKSSAIVLIICTIVSLLIANSAFGAPYINFWYKTYVGIPGFLELSIEHWVNDGLMAIFFLLIGLELERELYEGELSNLRNALLPIFAALGGLVLPALIHFSLNFGTPTQAGMGIPMATDIAFALGVLALLGSQVPASLKIFLTALAVMDDLGAIIVIAVFYTSDLSFAYLLAAFSVLAFLVVLNRLRIGLLTPYLIGGALMWFFMYKSGVHATIAGVLLAFAIPFTARVEDEKSCSYRLEHYLHKPVAFIILPIFALANTGVVIAADWYLSLSTANSMGIASGLLIGKPIGITVLSLIAIGLGICRLPLDLNRKHIIGAGFLGGIGFTMSIFITNLAFTGSAEIIDASKMAVLISSLIAGIIGFTWLKIFGKPVEGDLDMDTMDYDMTQ
jgi:NhaA family Na+:H+ antiporter